MKIEVFELGCCSKSNALMLLVNRVLKTNDVSAEVMLIDDMMQAITRGIMRSPALAVNGKIVCTGRMPNEEEVKSWLVGGKA